MAGLKALKTSVKVLLIGLLAWTLFASGMLVAEASHDFGDVPTSAFYHTAVSWIVARAITSGCAVGLYCPDNAVTRGQMAVFLRALGLAVTPTFIQVSQDALSGGGGLVWATAPVKCQTTDYMPTFPRQAYVHANASVESPMTGATPWTANLMYSINGGTWLDVGPISHRTVSAASEYAYTGADGKVDLNPGSNYRFGIYFQAYSGPATSGNWTCDLSVVVHNRNP